MQCNNVFIVSKQYDYELAVESSFEFKLIYNLQKKDAPQELYILQYQTVPSTHTSQFTFEVQYLVQFNAYDDRWWRLLNVMFVRLQNYVGDAWKVKSVLMINVNSERLDLFQWDAWDQFGSINPADSFNLNVIKPQTTN